MSPQLEDKMLAANQAVRGTEEKTLPDAVKSDVTHARTSRCATVLNDIASRQVTRVIPNEESSCNNMRSLVLAADLARQSTAMTTSALISAESQERKNATSRPDYWDQACSDLVHRDRILRKLIPQFGPVHLISHGDPFITLARAIIGQQISVIAAQTIWARLKAACPLISPSCIMQLGWTRLIECGLSKRKSGYILELAQHFTSDALYISSWALMDDEAVVDELTQIRGIGFWTAEMFLIFNLMRPNVLPLDDIGLIRSISLNYFSGEPVTRSEAREVAANWEPWRTVATWYMWRSLESLSKQA
ncbi:DNA-3-methyladenine glycosylase family protein [Candidatus Vallotia cooleyia]|uniref:DNA-3-methyladenine glycosylase family protein n=1 Tax=Candidatus Vallotiella adelgis TaxID=1177211 RepID=UPI001D0096ED|nr:DNA-3-methyladenine glycosylase [Candidatus Vallotia cooleyia]